MFNDGLRRKLIRIYGPKGFGKSTGLKMLSQHLRLSEKELHFLYIDLLQIIPNDIKHVSSILLQEDTILLLDNAQIFNSDFCIQSFLLVIAAYSPSAKVTNISDPLSALVGTSPVTFFFHPLSLHDFSVILHVYSYTKVAATETDSSRQLTNLEADKLYFRTNGNPRYIVDYLVFGNFETLLDEIQDQYSQLLDK